MNRNWPPNPRDAKYRRPADAWHWVTLTILLIGVCLVTALRTHMGKNSEREDWMYFQSQTQRMELLAQYDSLKSEWLAFENAETKFKDQVYQDLLRRTEVITNELENLDVFSDIKSGQLWRLITPVFLHFGMIHLLFNMYWLWSLGGLLEVRYGSGRFLLLFLLTAMLSNVAQALIGGPNFGGMSGVNYGLFGYMYLHGKFHPAPSFQPDRQTVFIMLAWLVLCFSGLMGTIANWAHLFGFLTGAAAGFGNAMLAGGGKLIKRRTEFKRSVTTHQSFALHRCEICGLTEHDNPDMEFRVSSDGQEYCTKHLPPSV